MPRLIKELQEVAAVLYRNVLSVYNSCSTFESIRWLGRYIANYTGTLPPRNLNGQPAAYRNQFLHVTLETVLIIDRFLYVHEPELTLIHVYIHAGYAAVISNISYFMGGKKSLSM